METTARWAAPRGRAAETEESEPAGRSKKRGREPVGRLRHSGTPPPLPLRVQDRIRSFPLPLSHRHIPRFTLHPRFGINRCEYFSFLRGLAVFGSIGMTELIVIFVVALVFIGPNRLPELARSIGKAFGDFKRATSGLKDSFSLDDDDFGVEADGEEKTAETETEQPGDEEEKDPAAGEASPPEANAAAPGDEPSPEAGKEPEGAAPGEGPDGGEADPPPAERTQAT